jgi:hypothetical protein
MAVQGWAMTNRSVFAAHLPPEGVHPPIITPYEPDNGISNRDAILAELRANHKRMVFWAKIEAVAITVTVAAATLAMMIWHL